MNKTFDVYKGAHGKAYAVFTDLSLPKTDMIHQANRQHFRGKLESLKCSSGYITKDGELFLSSRYVEDVQTVWVVHHKD